MKKGWFLEKMPVKSIRKVLEKEERFRRWKGECGRGKRKEMG